MKLWGWVLGGSAVLAASGGAIWVAKTTVGKQPDGTYIVSTARRIEPGTIAFSARPMDLAIHPTGTFYAVATNRDIFLADAKQILPDSSAKLDAGVSYRGLVWNQAGTNLFVSLSNGKISRYELTPEKRLKPVKTFAIAEGGPRKDVVLGGLCLTPDGNTLYVAEANGGQVLEIDTATDTVKRRMKVGNIPFECRLSEDGKTLIVSNWAGRETTKEDEEEGETDESDGVAIMVDDKGTAASGTVSLVELATGKRKDLDVGIHPCGLAVAGSKAWVANAGSDGISEIDLAAQKVTRTIPVKWNNRALFGSMPNTLAVRAQTLYACNGGDNAICEIDLREGKVRGFRPAGFFPVAVQVTPDGAQAFVCNTKGNGSVARTTEGKPGGVHDFTGTVSVIDLNTDLQKATERVVELNDWGRTGEVLNPKLPVFDGRIKHVFYIIKENKTYDSVFGDMKEGNGDPNVCLYPEEITPNAHKLAREFTLFDNAYVSGTNSAEGHQWAIEGLANDYIERFYGGYSRSYPFDGGDPMAYSHGGFIWDSVLDAKKTVRNYGEFCDGSGIKVTPAGTKWLDAWKDRESGAGNVKISSVVSVKRMRPYTHSAYPCWPISISDQYRADKFIEDFQARSALDRVPNLSILILPCDHGAGTDPNYPTVRAMVADNDLALGRVVEAISKSPQWKESAIIVMQDDAQSALDHIDGHRTVMLVASPYTKRGFVDSTMYTQISVIKTITMMLGTKSLTRFDAMTPPLTNCFTNTPDPRPYTSVPNRIPLDEMNKPLKTTKGAERFWAEKSLSLDFNEVDSADWYWLNRINWAAAKGWDSPYPGR